jgi:DNA-binding MarR family transcriptional regulator
MHAMADDEDLGALFARVTRRLIEAERPLLEARGLSMWAYVALTRLGGGPAPTQIALAEQMGYDKTRLIVILDQLAGEGLIERTPDPGDRRARIVQLTAAGRDRYLQARADIRAMESEMLDGFGEAEQATLRATLGRLAGGAG